MEHLEIVKVLWDYMKLNQEIKKSDVILGCGCLNMGVAETAARLYLNGYAKKIIYTGGLGSRSIGVFEKEEALIFRDIAISTGVQSRDIITETKSTNTGENFKFTKKLIDDMKLDIKSMIIVHLPYMERRCFATAKKQIPEFDMSFTSEDISIEEFFKKLEDPVKTINNIVSDVQKMMIYPKYGFQIEVEIPDYVKKSYDKLIELGYDKNVIKV